VSKKNKPEKKTKSKKDDAETYLAELGGFSFIAGFTSGGVPFGLPIELDDELNDFNHSDEIIGLLTPNVEKDKTDSDLPF